MRIYLCLPISACQEMEANIGSIKLVLPRFSVSCAMKTLGKTWNIETFNHNSELRKYQNFDMTQLLNISGWSKRHNQPKHFLNFEKDTKALYSSFHLPHCKSNSQEQVWRENANMVAQLNLSATN